MPSASLRAKKHTKTTEQKKHTKEEIQARRPQRPQRLCELKTHTKTTE